MEKNNILTRPVLSLIITAILWATLCPAPETTPAMATDNAARGAVAGEITPKGNDVPPELKDRIMLSLKAEKVDAYPGESIGLSIKLSYHDLSLRDIEYPRFPQDGLSAGSFAQPMHSVEQVNGLEYQTLEFTTPISGRKTGPITLGPAQLQLTLLLPSRDKADAFFGGQTPMVVTILSNSLTITIKPLPEKGRPADFSGAVGNFVLTAEVRPSEVTVDDPLSLITTITGTGSLSGAACPSLPATGGFSIHEPAVTSREGSLACEQVLMPLTDAMREIPALRFSFFDPAAQQYRTLAKGPFPIRVTARLPVGFNEQRSGQKPSTSISLHAEQFKNWIEALYRDPVALTEYLALSVLFTFLLFNRRWEKIRGRMREYQRRFATRRRITRGLREARKILETGDSVAFYTRIFRILQEHLAVSLQCPPGAITTDIVDKILKPQGLAENLQEQISIIFSHCDRARYAAVEFEPEEMSESLSMMKRITKDDIVLQGKAHRHTWRQISA